MPRRYFSLLPGLRIRELKLPSQHLHRSTSTATAQPPVPGPRNSYYTTIILQGGARGGMAQPRPSGKGRSQPEHAGTSIERLRIRELKLPSQHLHRSTSTATAQPPVPGPRNSYYTTIILQGGARGGMAQPRPSGKGRSQLEHAGTSIERFRRATDSGAEATKPAPTPEHLHCHSTTTCSRTEEQLLHNHYPPRRCSWRHGPAKAVRKRTKSTGACWDKYREVS
ncbi:UNVERIFIED_CONTAM: hypothetical protein FKN15_047294 [Acipenser sinensis]